jgi:hypothetical protein
MRELPELGFVLFSDFEVKGKGVPIDGVREEEPIGAVALEDAEEGFEFVLLLEANLLGENGFGVLFGNEGLVLDEATRLVGASPIGDVVEEEGEGDQALVVHFVVTDGAAGELLGGVEESHSRAVTKKLEFPPEHRFWEDTED